MKPYSCIFFDLDHTLWDYEANSKETLNELYDKYRLWESGIDRFEDFHSRFRDVNTQLWDLYDRGIIDNRVIREERFKQILGHFHAYEQALSDKLAHDYITICPCKGNLVPNAIDTLEYLTGHYTLTIITNGFEETQKAKLTAGKLHAYFDHVITSQQAGHRKPAREIFDHALSLNKIDAPQAIMIGDNHLTDIAGARNASIDAVLYNPLRVHHTVEVKYEIQDLVELRRFL